MSDYNNFWGAIRQRDVLVGFGYFAFVNVLLLGIVALANDVVTDGGSRGVQIGFASLWWVLTSCCGYGMTQQ